MLHEAHAAYLVPKLSKYLIMKMYYSNICRLSRMIAFKFESFFERICEYCVSVQLNQ